MLLVHSRHARECYFLHLMSCWHHASVFHNHPVLMNHSVKVPLSVVTPFMSPTDLCC